MAGDEHEEEWLLRSRVRVLAERSGLPVPPVEVAHDPRGRLAPARVTSGDDDREVVTVSSSLLHASPVEQVWHLAAALGHWVAPAPRRLRRWSRVLAGVLAGWSVGYGLLELTGVVDLPRSASLAVVVLVPLVTSLAAAAISRRVQRALDETGWEVLRRSGYDPVELTRRVFGDRRDPSWWTRPYRQEPAPSQRVAAAERLGGPEIAPPLY
jgi:hypothetical protein